MYIFRPPYTEQFVYTTIALVGWLLRLVDTQKAYSKYHVTLRDLGMQKIEAIRFVPDLHTVSNTEHCLKRQNFCFEGGRKKLNC